MGIGPPQTFRNPTYGKGPRFSPNFRSPRNFFPALRITGGNGDCKRDLVCDKTLCASQAAACGHSEACGSKGLCGAGTKAGDCVATDEGCGALLRRKEPGRCHADGKTCVAKTNADCAKTEFCSTLGWCSLSTAGQCGLHSTDDCLQTTDCEERARCTFAMLDNEPACVVATDADCKRAIACKRDHLCKAVPDEGTQSRGGCVSE